MLYNALKSLIEMDPELYNQCEADYEQSCLDRQHHNEERHHRWAMIQKAAQAHGGENHGDPPEPESAMQIELVSVPEKIEEEPEKTVDDSMVVDEPTVSSS